MISNIGSYSNIYQLLQRTVFLATILIRNCSVLVLISQNLVDNIYLNISLHLIFDKKVELNQKMHISINKGVEKRVLIRAT